MKILAVLVLFIICSCGSKDFSWPARQLGGVFFYEDPSQKDQDSYLVGKLIVKNKKLFLVETTKAHASNDVSIKENIKKVQLLLNDINTQGYIMEPAQGGKKISKDGRTVRLFYFDDSDFLRVLNSELEEYQLRVR